MISSKGSQCQRLCPHNVNLTYLIFSFLLENLVCYLTALQSPITHLVTVHLFTQGLSKTCVASGHWARAASGPQLAYGMGHRPVICPASADSGNALLSNPWLLSSFCTDCHWNLVHLLLLKDTNDALFPASSISSQPHRRGVCVGGD